MNDFSSTGKRVALTIAIRNDIRFIANEFWRVSGLDLVNAANVEAT